MMKYDLAFRRLMCLVASCGLAMSTGVLCPTSDRDNEENVTSGPDASQDIADAGEEFDAGPLTPEK